MTVRYYDWIAHHAMRTPERLAVVNLADGREFSYAQMHDRIGRLATHLSAGLGVTAGDRVAVLAHNAPETLEVQFACGRLGAIFVPLNTRLTVSELTYIVGDAAPRVMIHDAELAPTALEVAAACQTPSSLQFDASYEAALAAAQPLPKRAWAEVTHDDVSTIMYTSGTTGRPKGAMITHGMTFFNCVNLGAIAGVDQTTVQLLVLPLFHTGGLNCYVNPTLHAGGVVLIMRAFDPGATLRLIHERAWGLNLLFGVPSIYQFLCQHPDFDKTDFSGLRVGGVGGAPMPVPLLRIWEQRGVALQQGYGMTETSPAVLALDQADAAVRAGSAGKPVLHTEVCVMREDGTEAAAGEIGELWVRGPNVTPGYWNRPDANATSFTDGWLHTGDATRVDADGFFYIVDRWKDMYISGGENVYPAEVEDVLYRMSQIAEAAIIGVPDERWGESGLAVVVVKPGQQLSEQQVHEHCRAHLARFKCPRDVAFVEALPRNATGKVHKPTLRGQFVTEPEKV
ncbi:acid--CoA ligase [Camelimonas fluminis]|uniref:Long-chain fatty acid--CoA ligase n=1 Tax=Camelimonas fluminis TaxID=1576911 RepID=A0ABV7UJ03_9HYPH|nr:long-chain fatty acid--CoA ligase [Camelimonas fluminis]GHE68042.1 acid--CoA ligase [Camelimonas fluminis]